MRAQHELRRGRRGLLAAVAAALAALALVLTPAALDGARASFSATTTNAGDELGTTRLEPPSGLAVTQDCAAAPAITQRTATTAETPTAGAASVTLTTPAGTMAGDLLVAHIGYHDGAVAFTAPGWNLIGQTTDSGTHVTSAVYWRTATGTESPWVFSRTNGTSAVMAAGLMAFIGVRSPTAAGFANATNSGTTATTPSLTTTATNVAVVHLLTKTREALPTPDPTTGLYGEVAAPGSGGVGVRGAVETFAGPGATTSRNATGAESSAWVTQTLVLQRAPWAQVSWTASTSSWAGGYVLERLAGSSVQATSTLAAGRVSATQGPLVTGNAYTFRLTTTAGTWQSPAVTTPSFTSTC